jgi:phosphatidylinositol glycan class B
MDEWKHAWPQYLVMFGVLSKSKVDGHSDVATILQKLGYGRVWRTWNGFEEDEKRKGGVEVWKWTTT